MEVRFVSRNIYKIRECTGILHSHGMRLISFPKPIAELQTEDPKVLIQDKVLKAFSLIGRPLFVEHTGLYLSYLNQLPGGLTQIFWDSLEADRFSKLFGNCENPSVIARTVIGYTDGMTIRWFEGSIEGEIAKAPAGDRSFQWDCVFIPKGYDRTFAEMGTLKHDISMRRSALDKLASFLLGGSK